MQAAKQRNTSMGALNFYLGVYCAAVPDYSQVLDIPHTKYQQLFQACIGQRTFNETPLSMR